MHLKGDSLQLHTNSIMGKEPDRQTDRKESSINESAFFILCEALIFTYRPQTRHNKTTKPIYLKCFHCSSSTLIYYVQSNAARPRISLPSSLQSNNNNQSKSHHCARPNGLRSDSYILIYWIVLVIGPKDISRQISR